MSTELTPQGFEAQPFDEIRSEIVEAVRDVLGPVNTGSESAIGQLVSIMAEREALLVQALQTTYSSQYPSSAAGRSLDGVVQLTGITRREATRSVATVQITGDPNTVITEGSAVKTDNDDILRFAEDVTLDSAGEGEGQVVAEEAGPVNVLAGTITTIETPISGWDTVNNQNDGQTGQSTETDPELRLRRAESLAVTGAATVEAIRARLRQQVNDVSAVTIIENRDDVVDAEGRPPHSFEAIVQGGIDQDIADLIWLVKPAGIETVGNVTETVEDSQGNDQTIKFSRPVPVYIWVNVTLTPNGVGDFPTGAEALTKEAVVKKGSDLNVGEKVAYQSLFGPIYRAVDGLELASIEVASSSDPNTQPSTFEAANINIASNELSLWDEARVSVTINA